MLHFVVEHYITPELQRFGVSEVLSMLMGLLVLAIWSF